MTKKDQAAAALWRWFAAHSDELRSKLKARAIDSSLSEAITSYVRGVHPRLNWELGPESPTGGLFFAFSPGGNPELLSVARKAVEAAPPISGWTFRAGKPPKQWKNRVVVLPLEGTRRRVCFDDWRFSNASRADDVIHITLYGTDIDDLKQGSRQTLGWILLDAELGEEFTATHLIEMDVKSLGEVTVSVTRPIAELRELAR